MNEKNEAMTDQLPDRLSTDPKSSLLQRRGAGARRRHPLQGRRENQRRGILRQRGLGARDRGRRQGSLRQPAHHQGPRPGRAVFSTRRLRPSAQPSMPREAHTASNPAWSRMRSTPLFPVLAQAPAYRYGEPISRRWLHFQDDEARPCHWRLLRRFARNDGEGPRSRYDSRISNSRRPSLFSSFLHRA